MSRLVYRSMYARIVMVALATVCSMSVGSVPVLAQGAGDGLREQPVSGGAPFGKIMENARRVAGNSSYMGQRFDASTNTYLLRFMDDGKVIDVYVDAITAKIKGRERF